MEKEKNQENRSYLLVPLSDIPDDVRDIAVRWGDAYFPGFAIAEKHKLACDILNYAKEHCKDMEKKYRVARSAANVWEKKYKHLLTLTPKQLEAEQRYEMIRRMNIRAKAAEKRVKKLEGQIKILKRELNEYRENDSI